ncbi:hypothetical protein [Dyadobacter sp. CY312]|uniref:hypothetical protein n=1 Tax=Dyadobacter sp. CY312 TaxID=2907303 RepID=UPI001F34AC34|nr:hypothetical protein [Dyadobacter sp. CY312]MCE7043950.1 hypothetical protein [Dyadobacter sp. CY312]
MSEASLHYIDPFSILIIDERGILKRLFCPFKVVPILADMSSKDMLVEMVYKNFDNQLFYLIEGQVCSHTDFTI